MISSEKSEITKFLEDFNKKLPEEFVISLFETDVCLQVILKEEEKSPIIVYSATTADEIMEWLQERENITEIMVYDFWRNMYNKGEVFVNKKFSKTDLDIFCANLSLSRLPKKMKIRAEDFSTSSLVEYRIFAVWLTNEEKEHKIIHIFTVNSLSEFAEKFADWHKALVSKMNIVLFANFDDLCNHP